MAKQHEIFGIQYSEIQDLLVKVGTNLILSIVILIAGFWLSNIVTKALRKVLEKSNTDAGLVTFMSSATSLVLKVMVVVSAISQLGVEMTSFVALLGAIGLAIGMAFSGTLSNFAGGIMILVLKPFKVDDRIMAQGERGVVREIQIFNTFLYTEDNKVVILPNGPVANGNIINFTREPIRRVECFVSLDVDSDVFAVKSIILDALMKQDGVLTDKSPTVAVESMYTGALVLNVRAWVRTEKHQAMYYIINDLLYKTLKDNDFNVSNTPIAITGPTK
jgi:small conductance mechanosensitive channel